VKSITVNEQLHSKKKPTLSPRNWLTLKTQTSLPAMKAQRESRQRWLQQQKKTLSADVPCHSLFTCEGDDVCKAAGAARSMTPLEK
jgi:hypothetical protein